MFAARDHELRKAATGMKGELTILGILMLAVAQWYASDSPRSRKIAYGLFGLGAAVAVVLAVRGPL